MTILRILKSDELGAGDFRAVGTSEGVRKGNLKRGKNPYGPERKDALRELSSPVNIAKSLDEAAVATAKESERFQRALDALPDGYVIVGPRRKIYTKFSVKGRGYHDHFWQGPTRVYTSDALRMEIGRTALIPHLGEKVVWG